MKAWLKAGASLALLAMATPVLAGQAQADAAAAAAEAQKVAALGEAMRAADLWIEGQRRYLKIPAISAAVAQGDRTVWAKGFGTTDRAGKQAATPETIYSICSISKLFTAVALMQQWEQGKVALDAPITDYLPWAKLADDPRESVPITLRGALTHSAGLPRESDHPYWTGPDFPFPSQAAIRERMPMQAPLYPASTTWQYSNLGLTLVGETVEAVSGKPFATYVEEGILKPLALKDTRPGIPANLYGQQMAVGWGALTAAGERPEVKLFDPAGITPAAGFSSSVADLARFASWTFRLAKSGKPEVLRASTLREMQRVHYVSPDWSTSWGLGFAVRNQDGTNLVGHGGSCPGYRSSLMLSPKDEVGIAVAMNAMDNPDAIALGIGALLKARTGASVYPAVEGVKLEDFTGVYDGQPWSSEYYAVTWAGGLVWIAPDEAEPANRMWRLKPIGGDVFRVITDKGEERETVTFQRDRAGKVTGYSQHGNFNRRVRGF